MSVRERTSRMHTPGMTDSSPASQDNEMENEQPVHGEGSPVEHDEVSRHTFLSTHVREGKLEIRGSNRFNERNVMHQFIRVVKWGSQMSRSVVTAIGVVSFAVGSLAAASKGAPIQTFPVSFVLTSATCSNLPSGTVLTGSGTEKSITTTGTDRDGVVTVRNSTHAHGTATDQDGNTYVFNYSVAYRATLDGGVYSGFISDAFMLAGSGPARLNNGFVGDFVSDFSTFFRVPNVISSHGDPLDFVTGDVHCDPL